MTAWGQSSPTAGGQPASPPAAESPDLPRKLEDYGDWRALAEGSGEGRSCYVTHKVIPAPQAGRAKDRPLLYVTHRPGKNALFVVSYFAGYAIKPGTDVELDFGFSKFRLFVQESTNGAWSPSPEVDARIVEAMKVAWTVTVRGTDGSGSEVADTLSLAGFTTALWRASLECGVR